ncbi:MAG TPA: C45 family peptidase [Anaeromyxobacteraceae bacterium]|jgi:hypothetical protein|nr:C45 family peptidase [Anaeromyxobacteraceae bacterium]
MSILIHDAESDEGTIDWSCLSRRPGGGRALVRAFDGLVRDVIRGWVPAGAGEWLGSMISGAGAPMIKALLAGLNGTLGANFAGEAHAIANALDVGAQDVLLGNLAYDLTNNAGCSTFVCDTRNGPLHARNLDWPFPGSLLRRHTQVVRVHGAPAGDYLLVTWPGLFGALTAVAPGRFSVTVNFVTHRRHSGGLASVKRAIGGYWPVPWAVRLALDTAADFDEAVAYLKSVPLVSTVLFTVAGLEAGEMAVIERAPTSGKIRGPDDGRLWVTNHYVGPGAGRANDLDLDEDSDSCVRFDQLEASLARGGGRTAASALKLLSHCELASDITQQQVVMSAREGWLDLRVPGGERLRVSA